jgi:hypothetical protein
MADNYSQFSHQLNDLTDEEMAWFEKVLTACPDEHVLEEGEDEDWWREFFDLLGTEEICGDALDSWPGFEYSLDKEKKALWFYASEGYTEEALVEVFQAFLKRFRPAERIGISIAITCSKMRLDEFGGAWLVIAADSVMSGNTWDDIRRELS